MPIGDLALSEWKQDEWMGVGVEDKWREWMGGEKGGEIAVKM